MLHVLPTNHNSFVGHVTSEVPGPAIRVWWDKIWNFKKNIRRGKIFSNLLIYSKHISYTTFSAEWMLDMDNIFNPNKHIYTHTLYTYIVYIQHIYLYLPVLLSFLKNSLHSFIINLLKVYFTQREGMQEKESFPSSSLLPKLPQWPWLSWNKHWTKSFFQVFNIGPGPKFLSHSALFYKQSAECCITSGAARHKLLDRALR